MKRSDLKNLKTYVEELKLANPSDFIADIDKKIADIVDNDELKRELIRQRNKLYYLKTKEKRLKAMKENYVQHIKEDKVKCACGREILSAKYSTHCKSKIHYKLLDRNNPEKENQDT